ncbi:hypothetical protein RND81_14G248000 [Saponaria officinalis]|uniref:Uncharacterized protein n=1 Tax=Saponaria officinalis TaxID=3572 RepID=A0AAW1GU82_SAPOF
MNDETAKAMKVIRLKDERLGQYLTAGDDQVSVTLTKPETKGYYPKNTEWRVEWLNNSPKGLVGQVRLWSIYNKALTFDKDPDDYVLSNCSGSIKQWSWPPSHADSEHDFEWQFVLGKNDKDSVGAFLEKWSKKCRRHYLLCADKNNLTVQVRFKNRFLRWANLGWFVEVVTDDDNDHNNLTTSSVNRKIFTALSEQPLMLGHESANKAATGFEISTPVKNGHCHDKSPIADRDTNLSTIVNQKASAPMDQPRSLMQSPVCNKFTPMNNDQQSNHHHSARYARNNDIGQLHDPYMNMLSRCQIGQLFLQVSPTSTGFHASAGYKYGQYTNSGGNVNGSGVQKNGDVNLYSETNRSRDNSVNFVNYAYE